MTKDIDAKTDEAKGRAKEAIGDLTDDDDMKRDGKTDQASSDAKEAIGKVTDKAKGAVDSVADKFKD